MVGRFTELGGSSTTRSAQGGLGGCMLRAEGMLSLAINTCAGKVKDGGSGVCLCWW